MRVRDEVSKCVHLPSLSVRNSSRTGASIFTQFCIWEFDYNLSLRHSFGWHRTQRVVCTLCGCNMYRSENREQNLHKTGPTHLIQMYFFVNLAFSEQKKKTDFRVGRVINLQQTRWIDFDKILHWAPSITCVTAGHPKSRQKFTD